MGLISKEQLRRTHGAVHPHTCGANVLRLNWHSNYHTVHPHTCGANCLPFSKAEIVTRFIPTHVGLINGKPIVPSVITVHPHTCGANDAIAWALGGNKRFIPTHVGLMLISIIFHLLFFGSSPHMWG